MGISDGGGQKKGERHSRSYHRYFEGFAERVVMEPGGKPKIERVYVGEYYRSPFIGREKIIRKILYSALYIAAVALYGVSSTRHTAVNMSGWQIIPVGLTFPLLLFMLFPLYYNITAPGEMMVRQYRDASELLRRASLAAAAGLALSAVAAFIFAALNTDTDAVTPLLCGGLYLLASGAVFALYRLEKGVKYNVLPPKSERPESSSVIKSD